MVVTVQQERVVYPGVCTGYPGVLLVYYPALPTPRPPPAPAATLHVTDLSDHRVEETAWAQTLPAARVR